MTVLRNGQLTFRLVLFDYESQSGKYAMTDDRLTSCHLSSLCKGKHLLDFTAKPLSEECESCVRYSIYGPDSKMQIWSLQGEVECIIIVTFSKNLSYWEPWGNLHYEQWSKRWYKIVYQFYSTVAYSELKPVTQTSAQLLVLTEGLLCWCFFGSDNLKN